MLVAIVSVQFGSALATTLFDRAGPAGTVFYRLLFAAALLLAIWRPWRTRHDRAAIKLAVVFGAALAAMNLCFYSSLERIPLGIAVTFEFVGPLAVAVFASRTRSDLLWVALAAVGILLLAGPGGSADALGIALALAAGACWGAYILISARVGQAFSGGQGLAIAMAVGAGLMAVPGVAVGGEALLQAEVIAVGAAVALLSSVIPYSFELEALRTIPVGVFGVLMSLEPAVAALAGLVAIGQSLNPAEVAGIALVVAASAGVLRQPGAAAPRDA